MNKQQLLSLLTGRNGGVTTGGIRNDPLEEETQKRMPVERKS